MVEDGIALAQRHLPDVVLSDVMMPGTDGHELVRVLRCERRDGLSLDHSSSPRKRRTSSDSRDSSAAPTSIW